MSKIQITLMATLSIASAVAPAQTEKLKPLEEQASIPFVNHGSIRDWQANKQAGLWIQDIHRRWYYAETMGPCFGLDFANSIGFDTKPMDTLDRSSSVIVPNEQRCQLKSLTRSEGPPPRNKRKARAIAPAS
jgi:Family of unknown function (DUF6491)